MSAQDNLSPLQFEHTEDDIAHKLDAYHAGQHVGRLQWMKTDDPMHGEPRGAIEAVITDPDHRREGVGTALLNEGRKYTPRPRHSGRRTESGDAWAVATSKRPKKNRDPDVSLGDEYWNGIKKPDRPYQGFLF